MNETRITENTSLTCNINSKSQSFESTPTNSTAGWFTPNHQPGWKLGNFRNVSDFFLDFLIKKKLYGPFSWKGLNCLKTTKPLQGDSLLFTINSPVGPGNMINLGRMKSSNNLGATWWFWTSNSWIGNPIPKIGYQNFAHMWTGNKTKYRRYRKESASNVRVFHLQNSRHRHQYVFIKFMLFFV